MSLVMTVNNDGVTAVTRCKDCGAVLHHGAEHDALAPERGWKTVAEEFVHLEPCPRLKVVPLRASPKANAHQWTPLACLEDAVARVRSGEYDPSALAILFVETSPDGGERCFVNRAGLSRSAEFLWLHVAREQCLDGMRG